MDNLLAQQVPHDAAAEKAVLGAIFIDPEAINDVSAVLEATDFYDHANRIIYSAMLKLADEGQSIDPVTIQAELERRGQLDEIGDISYITDLLGATPTSYHVKDYAKLVHQKSVLRNLINASQKIITNAVQGADPVEDILSDAESEIMNVSNQRGSNGFHDIEKLVKEAVRQITENAKNHDTVTGLRTGFKGLDEMTTGLHEDELIILAARPGVGKTSFAMNIAKNVALEVHQPVAVFSLEMSGEQLVQRLIASTGLIDSQHLRTGNLDSEDWSRLELAAGGLSKAPLFIDDTPGIKISEIRSEALNLQKQEGKLGLVVIDYLQLIEGPRSESRQQEVSAISRQLKKMAKELHVPVIALSQLSRSVEQRQDKRPILSDLRESGSIEQDADIVGFLYREDYYRDEDGGDGDGKKDGDDPENVEIEVIIEKNRSGRRGSTKLMFSKPYNRFSNILDQPEN
ncbi:MAG: replicative DNA helicase [Lactobacillus porci]|nr:replicative DNA helicase [Lactobacillus porci]